MRRRRFLQATAVGSLGQLAGCTAGYQGVGPRSVADGSAPGLAGDPDLPVPREEMLEATSPDAIPAIVDPVFGADWSGVSVTVHPRRHPQEPFEMEPRLRPNNAVIGVVRDGEARAYPLRVLNWHEIVNDDFDGPLLVTYCPLCRSGLTAVRRVAGEATRFGVSGLLWRNALVMYDGATSSLWSQIAATAIHGDRTGETLELAPSSLTTWAEWRNANPGTTVLRPPPESDTVVGPAATRDYRRNPYGGYQGGAPVRSADAGHGEGRQHPKTEVLGISHGSVAKAYPVDRIEREDVINDAVGALPVVVTAAAASPAAYVRTVDGQERRFVAAGDRHVRAAGSRWRRSTGRAVDGRHEGTRLEQANGVSPLFWFAWRDFHPETTVYEAV